MRFLAAFLLLVAAVVQLLVGVGLVMASRQARDRARTEAGDLSSVSADLVTEQELSAMKAEGDRAAGSVGSTSLVLGAAVLVGAVALLVGGILLLCNRGRLVVLVAGGVCLAGLGAVAGLDRPEIIQAIAAGLSALGMLLTWLWKPRRTVEAT